MSAPERKACVTTARKALDENGMQSAPLCVGTGGESRSGRSDDSLKHC